MAQYDPSNNSESKSDLPEGLKSAVDISQIITGCKDKGAKQYQEDSYCTFESPDLTFLVAAVFDGHGGLNGRVASQKVAALSTEYFSNNWQKCKGWTNDEWTTEMTSFYHHLHQKVREEFIQDHSPDNADEYLRIKHLPTDQYPTKLLFVYDQANTCRKFECPIVFLDDGTKDPKYVKNPWGNHLRPTNVRYDPAVYAVSPYGVSHDITCIAMTRSLGDFYAHQFGLSNVPSVTFNELDILNADGEANEFIVTVGSDGVWDCWKWDDFSDYVNGVMTKCQGQLKKVCESVLKHTIQRAKACFGEGSYDDASLVCVALRPQLFKTSSKSLESAPKNDSNMQSISASESQSPPNGHSKDDNEEKEEVSVKGLDEDDD